MTDTTTEQQTRAMLPQGIHLPSSVNYQFFDALDENRVNDVRRFLKEHPEAARCRDYVCFQNDIPEHHDRSALNTAIWRMPPDVIRTMLELGADPNLEDKGWLPIKAVASCGRDDLIDLFVEFGTDIHKTVSKNQTAFDIAVTHGEVKTARCLKQRGVQPGEPDSLLYAVLQRKWSDDKAVTKAVETIDFIVTDLGADALKRHDGKTLLMIAACEEHAAPIIRKFMALGVDIDAIDSKGQTALMQVCKEAASSVADILLKCGAQYDLRDGQGKTALQLLFEENALPFITDSVRTTIHLLSSYHADPHTLDHDGNSPTSVVAANGNGEFREVLADYCKKHAAFLDHLAHERQQLIDRKVAIIQTGTIQPVTVRKKLVLRPR